MLIRPEQIRIVAGSIPARIEAVTFYGRDANVHLVTTEASPLRVVARVAGFRAPGLQDCVMIAVDGAVVTCPRGSRESA